MSVVSPKQMVVIAKNWRQGGTIPVTATDEDFEGALRSLAHDEHARNPSRSFEAAYMTVLKSEDGKALYDASVLAKHAPAPAPVVTKRDDDGVPVEIQKAIGIISKQQPGLTKEQIEAKAWCENPSAYAKYVGADDPNGGTHPDAKVTRETPDERQRKLEGIARQVQRDTGVTYEQAYAQSLAKFPELYSRNTVDGATE